MHLVVYISDYVGTGLTVKKDIEDIVTVAKVHNAVHGITGVLFYMKGQFLQVIEGEESNIRRLMDILQKDGRHTNIEYLIDTTIENRSFQTWNMDSFNLEHELNFSKERVRELTASFKENLVPRSDILVAYYKTLLAKAA